MQLHDFATGAISPTVAMIFATLGSLSGIVLVTLARRRTGWRRVRLVAYAIVAIALIAVYLPALIAVLALRVDGSVLRLTPEPLGYSLGAATGGTLLAVLVVCSGRPGPLRQILAGLFLVSGIGGTGFLLASALTTGLPFGAITTVTGIAVALAWIVGFGLAGALAATRTLRMATGFAVLLGLAFASVYHVAAAGLTLQPQPGGPLPADAVVGLSPQRIGLPAVISAAVLLVLIWYFTLGTATARDLRMIFEPDGDGDPIEPWMVEEVRMRVALSSTAYAPVAGWPDVWSRNQQTVAVHAIPLTGRGVIADAFTWPRHALTAIATEDTGAVAAPAGAAGSASPTSPDIDSPDIERPHAERPNIDRSDIEHPGSASPDGATAAEPVATAGGPEPTEPVGVPWRSVPAWGLPTSQWTQDEFDEAMADFDAFAGADKAGTDGNSAAHDASDRDPSDSGPRDQETGDQETGDQESGDQESGDQETRDQETRDQDTRDRGPRDWAWPAPGRNQPPAVRRPRPATGNSRFGPTPGPVRPMAPAHDLSSAAGSDPAAWVARLRAATLRAATHDTDDGAAIVHDYSAATPLPRRNARPINRP